MALVVAATASISSRILCLMRQPGLRPKAYDIIINIFASDFRRVTEFLWSTRRRPELFRPCVESHRLSKVNAELRCAVP